MKTISNFLKGNNKINWLSLGNNSLGLNAEENLKLIFEGLNGNKNLKKLSLSENILVLLMNTLNLYRDKSDLFNQPFIMLMQICGILYELEVIGLIAFFILFTIIIF